MFSLYASWQWQDFCLYYALYTDDHNLLTKHYKWKACNDKYMNWYTDGKATAYCSEAWEINKSYKSLTLSCQLIALCAIDLTLWSEVVMIDLTY